MTRIFEGPEMPEIRLVEPLGAPSLRTSLIERRRVRLEQVDGFVDGAAVAEIGALPFEILSRFTPEHVLLCPEGRLCQTMIEMLNVEGIVLEPAGALAIDALRALGPEVRGKTVVLVVSGGNFDFERLPDVKERALRFEGLKKYFILRLAQRPARAARLPGPARPGRRHFAFRIPEEVGARFRLDPARHRNAQRRQLRHAAPAVRRSRHPLSGHHRQPDHVGPPNLTIRRS